MHPEHESLQARFADAYERYAKDIQRFCMSKGKNKQEAEDLMQETFLRTWKYLLDGNNVDDLKAFLYRVVENMIVDASRRKKELSLDVLQEQGFDPSHEPVDRLSQSIDVQQIILSADKKRDHNLLVMRYVEGLRPVDIATRIGVKPNVVVVQLHRAVQKLMKKFVVRQPVLSEPKSLRRSR